MTTLKILGVDAAFANMGFADVVLTIHSGKVVAVDCLDLLLISTEAIDAKVTRKSSNELRRAKELSAALVSQATGRDFAMVEVPSGSQSANAARALGIAVGVLASCPVPIIEVSPMEVKFAVTQNKKVKASKTDIINWAVKRWPAAPWLRDRGKPDGRILLANEHLADALATVMAGIQTPAFQGLLAMIASNETTSPTNYRPTSRRVRLL